LSGVGPGTGDAVSTNVDYDPWLMAPFQLYYLKDEINALPNEDFKPPAADRKAALIDKINDVIAKIVAGEYKGAIMKLLNDIRPKLDTTAKQTWLVVEHLELLEKIDAVVEILEGLL